MARIWAMLMARVAAMRAEREMSRLMAGMAALADVAGPDDSDGDG